MRLQVARGSFGRNTRYEHIPQRVCIYIFPRRACLSRFPGAGTFSFLPGVINIVCFTRPRDDVIFRFFFLLAGSCRFGGIVRVNNRGKWVNSCNSREFLVSRINPGLLWMALRSYFWLGHFFLWIASNGSFSLHFVVNSINLDWTFRRENYLFYGIWFIYRKQIWMYHKTFYEHLKWLLLLFILCYSIINTYYMDI